jgi:hypothetical protein
MHAYVNVLGTITVGLCAWLLLRGYINGRARLLLWSGLCFVGLTVSNALLFVDLTLVPHVNLYIWRLVVAAVSVLLLVYGLVFESD